MIEIALTPDEIVLLREALRSASFHLHQGEYHFGGYLEGQKRAAAMDQLADRLPRPRQTTSLLQESDDIRN
jgi:hypothetical protein